MDPRILSLYDEYTHAPLPRRVFLDRLKTLAGGSAAAAALLPLLQNNYAQAAIVAADDARLVTGSDGYDGGGVSVAYYIARPVDQPGPWPGVMVIHENRGLNPHIEDVARRVALEGFLAIAPDMLSSVGGTPANEDAARGLFGGLDSAAVVAQIQAGLVHLAEREDTTGKIGIVGFCWGGGQVNAVAADPATQFLDAAVPYYGAAPATNLVPNIRAAMLLQYAALDSRINAGLPAFTAAMDAAGVDYTLHLYDGANHAFNNDTNAARYDAAAAELAWSRTIDFFTRTLKG